MKALVNDHQGRSSLARPAIKGSTSRQVATTPDDRAVTLSLVARYLLLLVTGEPAHELIPYTGVLSYPGFVSLTVARGVGLSFFLQRGFSRRVTATMFRKLLLSALLLAMLVVWGFTRPPPASDEPGQFRQPFATKVVLVILENSDSDAAYREKFLGFLAASGAYLANYHALAGHSQPNYVALVSGSTDGVIDNSPARLDRAHLGQKLKSWMAYAEGYPAGTCDLRGAIGRYVRKHVPFLSFADVQDNPDFCRQHITGFDQFLVDAHAHRLPSFSLVVPNLDHDAHDKPLRDADAWLERSFADLIKDPTFRRDVLLIVTFDEAGKGNWFARLAGNDNRVFTVLWGEDVLPGEVKTRYDHYDLLRTIEAIFDVAPMAAGDAGARPIGGIWRQRE